MIRTGVPQEAVRFRMEADGVDPDQLQRLDSSLSLALDISIERQLGRGKFGAVYKVQKQAREEDKNGEMKLALKIAQFSKPHECLMNDYTIDGVVIPPAGVVKEYLREIRMLHELSSSRYIASMRFIVLQPFCIGLELHEGNYSLLMMYI